jgi:hypothetical protein
VLLASRGRALRLDGLGVTADHRPKVSA